MVEIETPDGRAWGLLEMATIYHPEWHVRIDEVPRIPTFCYGDLVAVEAKEPNRFLRVVERGSHQPSLRVSHTLTGAAAIDGWLDRLEAAGWHTRDDEDGVVWMAAPAGADARAVLAEFAWVTSPGL